MRRILLSCLLLSLLCLGERARAEDETAGLPAPPTSWLVLAPVDKRARRPFNPDAVFERYLLDRRSVTPGEGTTVKGSTREATWTRVEADKQGRIGGRIAWAFATLESDRDRIVMASLRSGATLFVNGTPHVGAIYGDTFAVPVKLRKGTNELYVRGVRGAFKLTFEEPPAPVFVAPYRQILPDLVGGREVQTQLGVLVVNATEQALEQVSLAVTGPAWIQAAPPVALPVAPLGLVQVPIEFETRDGAKVPEDVDALELPVTLHSEASPTGGTAHTIRVPVRSKEKAILRTFTSAIDDSVQRFGMRAPLDPSPHATEPPPPRGLVLSLHGAGVNPRAQARAYSRKSDFWLFAPTNRDRFGFDWQDWGRLDAYEVLEEGLRISGVERERVYLTGHSMGGHGTWHLGANDPDGFAAIAPSAGWISFETYGGPRPRDKHVDTWHAADAASLTRKLIDNLIQLPTYILHGTKDDNVPPSQAREMLTHLTQAGGMPSAHFEHGAKHWWDGYPEPGAACVDWPAFYDLFRKVTIPTQPKRIRFTTVHPSVDSKHHWVTVHQFVNYAKPARVEARWRPKKKLIEVSTENVRHLEIAHPMARTALLINGVEYKTEGTAPVWWFLTSTGRGMISDQPIDEDRSNKCPTHCGPFKRAWTNRFVMVYGTAGTPEEDTALLEQARFDAQRWMYRAHGQTMLVSDAQYERLAARFAFDERNAVLYGNPSTNAAFHAWNPVYPAVDRHRYQGPRMASKDTPRSERVGDDIGTCSVSPSPDGGRLCAVVGSSGVLASRAGFSLMLFVSGAGWPDYTAWSTEVLRQGDAAVIETGFYDNSWTMPGARERRPMLPPLKKPDADGK